MDDGLVHPPERAPATPQELRTEPLVKRVIDLINQARPMPLSTSVMIQKDEILDLLEEALQRLPDELREARFLLKERQEYLAKAQREADDIIDDAKSAAARMVERTEVVKGAEQRARQMVDAAAADARRMQHEVEDFADQRLATFEANLAKIQQTVQAARGKLQATPRPEPEPMEDDPIGDAFFDQDAAYREE
jgi:cell division septum initiation protein DivIVA